MTSCEYMLGQRQALKLVRCKESMSDSVQSMTLGSEINFTLMCWPVVRFRDHTSLGLWAFMNSVQGHFPWSQGRTLAKPGLQHTARTTPQHTINDWYSLEYN